MVKLLPILASLIPLTALAESPFDRRSEAAFAELRTDLFAGTPFYAAYVDRYDNQFNATNSSVFPATPQGVTIPTSAILSTSSTIPHFFHGLGPDRETAHVVFIYAPPPWIETPNISLHNTFSAEALKADPEAYVALRALEDQWNTTGNPHQLYDDIAACRFGVDGATREINFSEDGALCGQCDRDFVCWTFDESVARDVLFTEEELATALNTTDGVALNLTSTSSWHYSAPLFLPSGDLFMVVTFTQGNSPSDPSTDFVIQRTADGTLLTRLVAHATAPANGIADQSPIQSTEPTRALYWDPSLNRVYMHVLNFDYSPYEYAVQCQGSGGVQAPSEQLGFTGHGLRVFDVATMGSGFIPLTELIIRDNQCEDLGGYTGIGAKLYHMGCGDEFHSVEQLGDGVGYNRAGLFRRLDLSLERIDVDGDGVRDAEEIAHGTDPFRADTDGDESSDRSELKNGTDPLTPEPQANINYRLGSLRSLIHPTTPIVTNTLDTATYGAKAPACDDTACYCPNGDPIFDLTTLPSPVSFGYTGFSQDGTYYAMMQNEGLWRRFIDSGTEELFISRAELDRFPDGELIPIDADHTYLWTGEDVVLFTSGVGSVVANFEDLVCEGGGGACDGSRRTPHRLGHEECSALSGDSIEGYCELPIHGIHEGCGMVGVSYINVLGYDHNLGRLLFKVRGNWDSWVVGIHPSLEPEVFFKGNRTHIPFEQTNWSPGNAPPSEAWLDLPLDRVLSTQEGWYLFGTGTYSVNGPNSVVNFGGPSDRYEMRLLGESDVSGVFGIPRPFRLWDDTLTIEPGAAELVRFGSVIDPGQIGVVGMKNGYFYGERVVGRGGPGTMWDVAIPDGLLTDVRGTDARPDGSMCMAMRLYADAEEEEFKGFIGFDALNVSDGLFFDQDFVYEVEDGTALDCMYDGDEVIMLVQAQSGDLELFSGPAHSTPNESVIFTDLPGLPGHNGPPPRLVRRNGQVEVFFPSEGDQAAIYENPAGQLISVSSTATTMENGVTGATIGIDGRQVGMVGSNEIAAGGDIGPADIIQRTDGIILVTFAGHLFALNPETGVSQPLRWEGTGPTWLASFGDLPAGELWPWEGHPACGGIAPNIDAEDPIDADRSDPRQPDCGGCNSQGRPVGWVLLFFATVAFGRRTRFPQA